MSTPEFKAIPLPFRICGHCNTNTRHPNGHCMLCSRIEIKAWKQANPEKQKRLDDDWREMVRAKGREYSAKRYAKDPERQKVASAKWSAANQDKRKGYAAIWVPANQERLKAWRSAHYEANKERYSAYHAEYIKNNRILIKTHDHNYRARKLANGGKLSNGIAAKLFKLQKGKCACCCLPLGVNFHLDHIQPLALGGPNIDSNVQLLRQRCNNQKGKSDPLVFMQRRGFLL